MSRGGFWWGVRVQIGINSWLPARIFGFNYFIKTKQKNFDTCVVICPVVAVLGAAAQNQVQQQKGGDNHQANADCDVEGREVAVLVLGEVLVQVGVTRGRETTHFSSLPNCK
jgi:hypothetical protein